MGAVAPVAPTLTTALSIDKLARRKFKGIFVKVIVLGVVFLQQLSQKGNPGPSYLPNVLAIRISFVKRKSFMQEQ